MKNFIENTKAAVNNKVAKISFTAMIAASAVGATFCETDPFAAMDKVLDIIYKILTWGGTIILGFGVVTTGMSIMKAADGEDQQGKLKKGLGSIVGGLFMIGAQAVMKQIIG